MTTGISDEKMKEILDQWWDDIVYFAYEGYLTSGPGVVGFERILEKEDPSGDQFRMSYVVYDCKAGKPDEDTVRLISDYDPKWETVTQYVRQDGALRTQRIRTAPGARTLGGCGFLRG